MRIEPLVSIIIPTKDSEKTLFKCLESINNQTYENIEVKIVDDISRDGTIEIAKLFDVEFFSLQAGRAEAKNFGTSKSRGRYLFFIDSDMELTINVVQECIDLFKVNNNLGGIIVPEISVGNSFWIKVRNFEKSFYIGTEIESARFFKRNLIEKTDGFNEGLVFFEESTLPQKIESMGYNVKARITSEILHHEEDFKMIKWLKKKYYYGKSSRKYKKNYGDYSKKQLNLLYRLNLFFKKNRFYSKPIFTLGVLILKFLESISVGFGLLSTLLNIGYENE